LTLNRHATLGSGVDILLAETITSIRTAQMADLEKSSRMGASFRSAFRHDFKGRGLISGESSEFWNAVSNSPLSG
jgi:hypothetical protein